MVLAGTAKAAGRPSVPHQLCAAVSRLVLLRLPTCLPVEIRLAGSSNLHVHGGELERQSQEAIVIRSSRMIAVLHGRRGCRQE